MISEYSGMPASNFSSLMLLNLTIYENSSEAIHGTLYGAVFHWGVYNPSHLRNLEEFSDNSRSLATLVTLMTAIELNGLLRFILRVEGDADSQINDIQRSSELMKDILKHITGVE